MQATRLSANARKGDGGSGVFFLDFNMSAKTDAPLPYYKWLWQDWRSNRTVQRMGYVDRGLYRELLDECWVEGSIPSDIDSLADICNCPVDVMANAWQVLARCFVLLDGRYHNEKLDSLRTDRDSVRVKRRAAGRLGGIRKALNKNETVANASQLPKVADVCHIEEKRREEKSIDKSPVADAPVPKRLTGKGRTGETKSLNDWLTACREQGVKPISDDDPIRAWSAEAGIPDDYMRLAWMVFTGQWKDKKPQKDWPSVFRNAIRRNWLKLWYFDNATGDCKLTTAGEQERRAHE